MILLYYYTSILEANRINKSMLQVYSVFPVYFCRVPYKKGVFDWEKTSVFQRKQKNKKWKKCQETYKHVVFISKDDQGNE